MTRITHKSMNHFWIFAILLLFPLMGTPFAHAHNVTFTRDQTGNNSGTSFTLRVVLEQQSNAPRNRPATKTKGDCLITRSLFGCTIENFPGSTNALVTVYHLTVSSGAQGSVIGKIQFWVNIGGDAVIHIPTGVASFKANMTRDELNELKCCDIAIIPQGTIEMGETVTGRPNSGTADFGKIIGNCTAASLGSDQGRTCTIDMLAGCYSPVFARDGSSSSNKEKIWVNRATPGGADHGLCIGDGQVVEYLIEVM